MLPQILVSTLFKIFSPSQILQIHPRHYFERTLLAETLSLTANKNTGNPCQPIGEYLVQYTSSNHRVYFGASKQHSKIQIKSWSITVDLVVNSFTDYRVWNTHGCRLCTLQCYYYYYKHFVNKCVN